MKRLARSFLFVPGNRSDRFEKAAASGAHSVVIDLEDAVAPAAKNEARDASAAWLKDAGRSALVRVNGADTEWYDDDMRVLKALPATTVMLPKADIDSLTRTTAALSGRPVIALIETVKGFMEMRQLAQTTGLTRIAFGSVDFGVETGIEDRDDAMTAIRTQIVLESCYAGLEPPIDGVSLNFKDEDLMRRDALRSYQLGYGGKLCIHPGQVAAVNAAFSPDPSQVEWARRVLSAFEESGGGATTVDGKMIDRPVVEQARRIIADADG